MIRRRHFLTLIALFAVATAWAIADPTPEERDRQRRLVELRKHPEQLARLRDHLKSLLELPEKRRNAIAKLDQDLAELSVKKRTKLQGVLDRYADWLDQLRQKDAKAYQKIKDAPDASTRLALIKEQRDREWMELQPKKHREEWAERQGPARAAYVAELRTEARKRHDQWLIAKRFWRELESKQPLPSQPSDLPVAVKKYVDEYLMPFLSAEEKKQLTDAERKWPDYPQALVEIASKHPAALPVNPPREFTHLPVPVQSRLTKKGDVKEPKKALKDLKKELHQFEGPSFASKVVAVAAREKKYPFNHEYLAATDAALGPPMKDFVEKKLMPVLDQAEKRLLIDNLGKWPEYPMTIRDLSKKHELSPPWHILPDPDGKMKWDFYRSSRARSWGGEPAKDKKTP